MEVKKCGEGASADKSSVNLGEKGKIKVRQYLEGNFHIWRQDWA
jgi:hypothetical protein